MLHHPYSTRFGFLWNFWFFFFFRVNLLLTYLFDVNIHDIIESFSKLSLVFNVPIEILLEKVNLRLIRQSIENDAGTFLFHFKFDHIFFNKFFLQFHQVVYLQVFEGLPLLLALFYVPHLEIVISKIVTIIERMSFRLNVETVRSFLFANEVQIAGFGISVHSQTWFGGNL